MENNFEEPLFREIDANGSNKNVIKCANASITGTTKISIEEDSHDGVKIILKKDSHDTIKEIKFICSCGQTKSIILAYSEQ